MLKISRQKVKGLFLQANILSFRLNERFDAVISMFAVLNHLKSYKELKLVLENAFNHLKQNGKFIFDLHNPQFSGQKTEAFNNLNAQ